MLRRLALVGLLVEGCARPQPPAPRATPAPVVLLAAGDLMLDRGVAAQQARHGADHPMREVRGLLGEADLALANLEGPITESSTQPCLQKEFSFRFAPSSAPLLRRSGLRLLSLANNHVLDCGRPGLIDTLRALSAAGLQGFGAGLDAARARAPLRVEVRGVRLAFVGFTRFLPESLVLHDDAPGVAFAAPEAIRSAVAAARTGADVVVVSFHWGHERSTRPDDHQLELARLALEAGADVVLGHHPHVLQGLRLLRPSVAGRGARLVAYSLGNFVFDQRYEAGRQSLLLRCELDRRGLRAARLVPLRLEAGQPRPATGEDRAATLRRLAELSAELGTRLSGEVVLSASPLDP
jgi:poly-gamma-glutamate capsule biosynthesis protein CapA/YwtB (metallophosphatase superfamily)